MNHFGSGFRNSHTRKGRYSSRRYGEEHHDPDGSQSEELMLLNVGKIAHHTRRARKVEKVEGKEAHVVEHGCKRFRPCDSEIEQKRRRHLIKTDQNLAGNREGRSD